MICIIRIKYLILTTDANLNLMPNKIKNTIALHYLFKLPQKVIEVNMDSLFY